MLFLQLYGKILIFDNFFKITKQRSLLFLEGSLLNVCKELLVFLSFSAGRTTSILFPDGQKGEGGRKGRGEGRRVEELIRAKLSKPVILKRYKTLQRWEVDSSRLKRLKQTFLRWGEKSNFGELNELMEGVGIIIKLIVEMKIYYNFDNQDVEVISDSYKFEYPPEFEGAVIEVQSKMVIPKGVEVDIGCGNAFGGTNEDEEGGAGNEEPVLKVNDLIDGFKYEESNMDKPQFQAYIRDYLKRMMTEKRITADRLDQFKKGCTAFVKFVLSKFADFTFYTPSDYSQEGALIYSTYKHEEDEAPVFYYILEGLPSFKV